MWFKKDFNKAFNELKEDIYDQDRVDLTWDILDLKNQYPSQFPESVGFDDEYMDDSEIKKACFILIGLRLAKKHGISHKSLTDAQSFLIDDFAIELKRLLSY
jgi:hypothetical protein